MGSFLNSKLGSIGTSRRLDPFNPRLSVPKADLIVSLLPAMIEAPVTAYGYRLPALKVLAMLTREYGANIQTLLLLGEHVLQHPAAPVPVALPADVVAMAAGYAASFSVRSLPGLEGVSAQLKRQSRLWLKVTIANALQTQEVLDRVRASEGVEYVEMYPVMTVPPLVALPEGPPSSPHAIIVASTPPPGDWPSKWINRPRTWETPVSSIAVLDSGCDAKHPALSGCINYGSSESKADGYGHGTFVCGVVSARMVDPSVAGLSTSNGYGAVPFGVTPNAKVLAFNIFDPTPLKSLKNGNEILTYTIDPSRYFTGLKMIADPNRGGWWKDISVVNLSIRYDGSDTVTEKKCLDAVATAKVAVVAASGNANNGVGSNVGLVNPARHAMSLAVGAMNVSNGIWPATHGGAISRKLDIYAPGVSVLSALPLASNALGRVFSGRLTGTSAAAPFMTAAVAMAQVLRNKRERGDLLDELKATPGPRLYWKP